MMKVKHWMTPNPMTIGPEAPMVEAGRIMKERGFRRLPVMENGRLVGLVTYRNILEAQPSPVTSLSVHEARYLTLEMKVKDVMRKNPVTVGPEDDIFNVLMEGNQKGIGGFPVVDNGRLVGIVTATDLFDLFIRLFGGDRDYSLYLKENEKFDDPQLASKVSAILGEGGYGLKSFITFPPRLENGKIIMLRLDKPGRAGASELLKNKGYLIFE